MTLYPGNSFVGSETPEIRECPIFNFFLSSPGKGRGNIEELHTRCSRQAPFQLIILLLIAKGKPQSQATLLALAPWIIWQKNLVDVAPTKKPWQVQPLSLSQKKSRWLLRLRHWSATNYCFKDPWMTWVAKMCLWETPERENFGGIIKYPIIETHPLTEKKLAITKDVWFSK